MLKNCACDISTSVPSEEFHEVDHFRCHPCSMKKIKVMLAVVGLTVLVIGFLSQVAVSAQSPAQEADVALEGHCPICITKMGKWVKGSPEHQSTYDGKTYYFPSKEELKMFESDPAKFVPALGGDCTVCFEKMQQRVPGSINHSVQHEGRLFLFPSDKEKEMFLAAPGKFANSDLALNGNCPVCQTKMKTTVPGKPEFTAFYHGLRYQFPSDAERKMFLASPEQFIEGKKSPRSAELRSSKPDGRSVSIEGVSGCAGCQYGVTPIGAPEELGLAVTSADGGVFVIEDAHTKFPEIYSKRFTNLKLQVRGNVLQRKDEITWIRPQELRVVN